MCVCVRERERERKRQAADFCWVPVSVDGSPAAWGRRWLSSRWLSETELGGCSGGMDGKRRREREGGEREREREGEKMKGGVRERGGEKTGRSAGCKVSPWI